MKKILYIITKASFGGAQRYVLDLALSATRTTFQPILIYGAPGKLSALLADAGIRTMAVPSLGRDINIGDDIRAFFSLYRLLAHERPDVVHLNSSKAGGLGALAARLAGIPRILFTIHGLPQDEPRNAVSRVIIGFMTWLTSILSHHVICISGENYNRVKAWPFIGNRARHIPNGITSFETLSATAARDALHLPHTTTIIGTIAELTPNKGLDVLIRALPLLPLAHVVIIGDGDERSHLGTLARTLAVADRVHVTGYLHEARQYLLAFDVFCLPSRKEGLPYVLLEAGWAGVPIVASDIPGIREIVGDEGVLVPSDDPEVLARALIATLKFSPQREHMTRAVQERVEKEYTLNRMRTETYALYSSASTES